MELHARKPPELNTKGSMVSNWREWKQQFMIYVKASGASDWSTDRKACLLLNLIGLVGQQVAKEFSPDASENMDILMQKFDDHFSSKVTEAHERYVFFSSIRQSTDTIDQYVKTLKIRAKVCNFGDLMESLIRDKIILDMKHKGLRKHLLDEPNLNLNDTIELWKMKETAEKMTQLCLPESSKDTVIKPEYKASSTHLDNYAKSDTSSCGRCGTRHDPKCCSAWGKKCENCGMMNHVAKSCTKPSISNNNKEPKYSDPGPVTKIPAASKYFNPGPFTQIPALNRKNVSD